MSSRKVRRDGHIHSPYCPHGTKDLLESYIERAIALGIEEISFTEHMPFPDGVIEPKLQKESGIELEQVMPYFRAIDLLKEKYKGKIKINKGFEVDYIEGYEKETKRILDLYGNELEDGILSVHVLKIEDKYHGIDMSPETFGVAMRLAGGLESLYDCYFNTLLKAIYADLGKFKPKRIGHPTLVRIFNSVYPLDYKNKLLLEEVVSAIKHLGYQIDFNTAGLRKPFCNETYPADFFLELVKKYDIERVYGSDAHSAVDVGSAFESGI
ncbi:histidinol-phosphatase HisJ [Cellulosilyticum sp. I15G10I2]|uniref:histidinol-phosphatase HisJ n=1 Tax=Cellulosilyticum sp. I15G10I2 TaxID=1892843 RepID=UPI00085C3732|nr:histidinol-phosphatase HisJ [Cellulosilyticum sp. I15G10I2]